MDAGSSDGGVAPVAIYGSCPDAPPVQRLDAGSVTFEPGVWMSEARASRTACIIATCEERLKQRDDSASSAPPPWWWIAMSTIAAAGIALGYGLGKL